MSLALALVSFNQPAAQCLVDLINQTNNQAFTQTQLVFQAPSIGVIPTDTKVVITPANASGLTGSVTLDYQRLDIGAYFEGANPTLYIQGSITVQTVLDALLNQFQIYGTPGSFDGFTITFNSDSTQATIVPIANHLVWVGTLTCAIDQRPLLSGLIPVSTLNGFIEPSALSASCPQANVVYGLVNGNTKINELLLYQSGYNFNQYLATWDIGTDLLDEPWYVNPTPGNYNLYGATVLYNGPAVGPFTVPTSTGVYNGYVLILNLSSACLNRCGQLYIVYQPILSSGGGTPAPTPSWSPAVPNLLYN